MKPFPIPVVPFGPGSQPEDDGLDYMVMPKGMETYHPPMLPEPEALKSLAGAHQALRQVLATLERAQSGLGAEPVDLSALTPAERDLINQVMGEGEVSVKLDLPGGSTLVQESVFAGVWRVISQCAANGQSMVNDRIEVGRIPQAVLEAALALTPVPEGAGRASKVRLTMPEHISHPEGVMNAPSVLSELDDHLRSWRPGQQAHVVNFTLLPLSPQDLQLINEVMGAGSIQILSRGYGNCRIQSTGHRHLWRVSYFNSQDAMILDTVEITDIPEVACAAPEDLADSHERLLDMMAWVEG
jgi:hydrogenase-1 operon protein HyaF